MPEIERIGELRAVAVAVADAVLEVQGVVRLEPTLRGQILRLSADPVTAIRAGRPDQDLPDGVVLRSTSHGLEARIDVAVRPVRPATVIAEDVRTSVRTVINATGRTAGVIMVSVLAVERH